MTQSPAEALDSALAAAFGDSPPPVLGVAVSGGGDSVALTSLLDKWTRARGVVLRAATVNHGLRAEAAAEAAGMAQFCASLGVAHETLLWQGWDGRGNLQDAARRARQRLLTDWARLHAIGAVALGHTQDDQAETVLLRLARGSGVDGLSGMSPCRVAHGVTWARPLLTVRRAALRDLLRAAGIQWAEDPSNDDPRFDRVKARQALAALAPLGIDLGGLVATAARMTAAREALVQATVSLFDQTVTLDAAGDVLIDAAALDAPADLRDRLLAQVLVWLGRAEYRPRHAALHALIARLIAGRGGTLMGCDARRDADGRMRLGRELRALASLHTPLTDIWDGRWRIHAPDGAAPGLSIKTLGEVGLALCPDWRATALPRRSLLTTPAVWRDTTLIAAPLARHDPGWRAELLRGRDDLRTSFLLH